jgi:hypothetical protein
MQSGSKVMELFANRGWTALINDNLVDNVLIAACFSFAVVSAFIGSLVSLVFPIQQQLLGANILISPVEFFFIIGFIIGVIVGSILTHILKSGVTTVFVCLAEDPYALQVNHPAEYQILASSWNFMYPNQALFTVSNPIEGHSTGSSTSNSVPFQPLQYSNQMHHHNQIHGPNNHQQEYYSHQNQVLPVANVV